MNNNHLEKIEKLLAEIYRLDPDLRSHEPKIKILLTDMLAIKPDTELNQAFVTRLKAELMTEAAKEQAAILNDRTPVAEQSKYNLINYLINLNPMNKKIYLTLGSVAVLGLIMIAGANIIKTNTPGTDKLLTFGSKIADQEINRLATGAFGSLAGLNPVSDGAAFGQAGAMGLGGDRMAVSDLATNATEAQAPLASRPAAEVGAMDMAILPMPVYGFKYAYQGERLELTEASGEVFRRLKGDGPLARSGRNLLGNFRLPLINLGDFRNPAVTHVSLAEERDQGLLINVDFREEQIYISENWEKWRIPERENCGPDPACWERWRLKPSDVPADNELIAMADRFLATYSIDLTNYDRPRVIDNQWREIYARTNDLSSLYIPEYATVIYPLIINGETAYDQGGGYHGLRVNINLFKKAASGLSGLQPYRYETSNYELETDFSQIIAAAEKGGWNRGYWGGDSERIMELGSPKKIYVQFWRYQDGRSDELLVPALAFPILNPLPDMYYGPTTITVPLVKEMLAELNSWTDPVFIMKDGAGGGVMPAQPTFTPELIAN